MSTSAAKGMTPTMATVMDTTATAVMRKCRETKSPSSRLAQYPSRRDAMNLLQDAARKTADLLGRQSSFVDRIRPIYESVLDWTSFGKGIPWVINGVTYRVDPHCRHQLGGNYDAPVAAFIANQIKPGAVCVDVGANVGI